MTSRSPFQPQPFRAQGEESWALGDFSAKSNEPAVSVGSGTPLLGWIMNVHTVLLLRSQFSHVEANLSHVCAVIHVHVFIYYMYIHTSIHAL